MSLIGEVDGPREEAPESADEWIAEASRYRMKLHKISSVSRKGVEACPHCREVFAVANQALWADHPPVGVTAVLAKLSRDLAPAEVVKP